MMQFMVIVQGEPGTEALSRLDRHLTQAGVAGLAVHLSTDSPALALSLWPDGERVDDVAPATHGPVLAGFRIIDVPSKDAALVLLRDWAAQETESSATLELRESGCPGGCPTVLTAAAGAGERYVILLRSNAFTERDAIPAQVKLDTLNAFNAAQARAGILLAGDGLKSTARGMRVKPQGGKSAVFDGPFTEAKELIAGFWMVRAHSLAEALDWARGLPYPTGPEVEVEIRAVAADVPAALSADDARLDGSLRAEQLDAALRAELAPQPAWDRP
jgi:hypothetical protein